MKQPLYWLAHRQLPVAAAALLIYLVLVGLILVPVHVPLSVAAVLGIALLALTGLCVVLDMCGSRHDRHQRPCLYCIKDFPLNGGARISRFPTLVSVVFFHVVILFLLLDLVVAGTLATIFVVSHQPWAFIALFGSISVTTMANAFFTHRHRQLEPWCPICHPPEGWNSGAPVGDPDPSMVKTT